MENQETTFPQLTPKDFTDPTAFRINSIIRDLYDKLVSTGSQVAKDGESGNAASAPTQQSTQSIKFLAASDAREAADGSRIMFTFDLAPSFVVYNGQLLRDGATVSISDNIVTFTVAPEAGADIYGLA